MRPCAKHMQCIKLPSERTLRDYTHHLKPGPGYSRGVDAQLSSAAKLDKCEERERCVYLMKCVKKSKIIIYWRAGWLC